MNYLTQTERESDDVLDMVSHKNIKFPFCQINQYFVQIGKPLKLIRHTVIADDDYALTVIEEKNGSILLNVYWKEALRQEMMNRNF